MSVHPDVAEVPRPLRVPASVRSAARAVIANPRISIPAAMLLFALVIAVGAPLIAPHDPNQLGVGARLTSPDASFPMGTDSFGRDQLSRVFYGTRVSLLVAVVVALGALAIGFPLGLLSGYLRGPVDFVVGRFLDVVLSFPGILLALALAAILRGGVRTVLIALTIVYVPVVTRFVRAAVLAEREREYIVAGQVAGASVLRILLRHLVPNIASGVFVLTTSIMAFSILSEAALSYLGFGTQPPTSSWGKMLAENTPYLSSAPYLVVFPGLAITWLVLALSVLGDALRDKLDPRQREVVEHGGATP